MNMIKEMNMEEDYKNLMSNMNVMSIYYKERKESIKKPKKY